MANECLKEAQGRLTATQRAMVEENLALVALHIRKKVRNPSVVRADRNYDDLYQEGCCGLIRAVQSYDRDSGIPFPAYALPRIHTAVSAALQSGSSLVRVPRRGRPRKSDRQTNPASPPDLRFHTLEHDPPDRRRQGAWDAELGVRTIGDRLRERHERALEVATGSLLRRKATRGDRKDLVVALVEQRLRVAEPSAKTALRQIARQTGSSYTRVLQCERRLYQALRRALAGDAEFRRLVELSRRSEEGFACALTESLERELRMLSAEGFVRRVRAAGEARQSEILLTLLRCYGDEVWNVVRRLFAELPQEAADELTKQVSTGD